MDKAVAQAFPLVTADKWLGNAPAIVRKHYVKLIDVANAQPFNPNPATHLQEDHGAESNTVVPQT